MSNVWDGRENDYPRENENQLAVWIRNVPTWLNEDRFYDEIRSWQEVDSDKSHVFKNKQDNNWVGVRYGWAIVTFLNKEARTQFLQNEQAHFVSEAEGKPYEKLKVTPWFDKASKSGFNNPIKSEKPINRIPLYKSDLEKEPDLTNPSVEDFNHNCTENSIQAYRGKVHSYCTNLSGQGHVGLLEVKVRKGQTGLHSELVVFHSDSVWMCFKHKDCKGTVDCSVKCGTDNFLPNRLRIGTEVYFTGRKIPPGVVDGKRYQAKAVWLGSEKQPNFISPPPAKKLDDYLEDYIQESGGGYTNRNGSKEVSPVLESFRSKSEDSASPSGDSGTSSPLPIGAPISKNNRPKPLKGGLNQLNSYQDKQKPVVTLRKPTPTNFAQAVSAVPTLIREEHSNLVLAVGFVESILSEVEASVIVPDHGTFNLHIQQLDLGFKPTQGISKYLTSKLSTLSVTLKQSKALPGSKSKYEIVRAHLNEESKKYQETFDPFFNEYKPKENPNDDTPAVDTWEDLDQTSTSNNNDKNGHENNEFDPIDLDELDKYYDDLQGIIDYLAKELPKVIPSVANDEKRFHGLAHGILSSPRSPVDEAKELQNFMDQFSVSNRIKNIFISEYIKFREQAGNVAQKVITDKNKNKDYSIIEKEKVDVENGYITNAQISKEKYEDKETEEFASLFFDWIKNAVKNKEVLNKKIKLYTGLLQSNPVVAKAWLHVVKNSQDTNFISFLNKSTLGVPQFEKVQDWLSVVDKLSDWATFTTWLEGDSNHFRLEGSEKAKNAKETLNSATTSAVMDPTFKLFHKVDLSKMEKEFIKHQDSAKETSVFILRAILFLKKSEVKLEGIQKLFSRHLEESPKPRNRDFNHKVQGLLGKRSSQKMLDETNTDIQKQGGLKMKEHTPISYRRLDKFIPILAQSLCGFFSDTQEAWTGIRANEKKQNSEEKEKGEREKVVAKRSDNIIEDNSTTSVTSRKRRHDQASTPAQSSGEPIQTSDSDFGNFAHFMKLSIASGRFNLASTTTVEAIIWSFQAANVTHEQLKQVYQRSLEQGGCSWQLQVSQLQLNPPLGVTVPDIADYLSAYFSSISSTTNTLLSEEEVVDDGGEPKDESELLQFVQDNLYEQYKRPEITEMFKSLKKSSIKIRESDIIDRYEELFSSHYLFNNFHWPHDEDTFDFYSLCSLLTAGIWHDLNVSSDLLSISVKNIKKHDASYQSVLVKWAKLLETCNLFSTSILDIFTIIKGTIMVYDENVFEEDLLNISTNNCLYNMEGIVSAHLSPSFYSVQTRKSLVLCHLGITFCCCRKEDDKPTDHPLPAAHWKDGNCCLDSCLPVGSRVLLHSTGVRSVSQDEILCQIADLVWEPDQDRFDPPETGIILPASIQYREEVQVFAQNIVTENQPEIFSNTSFAFNQDKYNDLVEKYPLEEEFLLSETWSGYSDMEMRKMFVFSEMGGMSRQLLRSNWAAMLNTSDQEKERLLNQTFNFFQADIEAEEMISFIKPYVKKGGLRSAMKMLDQKYPRKTKEAKQEENQNDTDSEKRQHVRGEEVESNVSNQETDEVRQPARNRQLSMETIKDETLWMAENNLEQLWADSDRILTEETEEEEQDLNSVDEEVLESDEEEEAEDEEYQLEVIVQSDVKEGSVDKSVKSDTQRSREESQESRGSVETEDSGLVSTLDLDRVRRFEEAVLNMSSWQPVASELITNHRDLIVALNHRVEFLEAAVQTLSLKVAEGEANQQQGELKKEEVGAEREPRAVGRSYVKIAKEGTEDDIAEVPTNSDGTLPQQTVKALFEGTSAIKFHVTAETKTWRALLLEDELFHPPDDGWGERVYICAQPQGCAPTKSEPGIQTPVSGQASGPRLSLAPGPSLLAPHTDHLGLSSYYTPQTQPSPYHMAHIWGQGGGGLGTSLSQVSPLPHPNILVSGALGIGAGSGVVGTKFQPSQQR